MAGSFFYKLCKGGNIMNSRDKMLIFLVVLIIFSFTGCATIEGAGEDIETAGEEIQDAADN
jgi:predicted small secreted protein